MDTLVLSSTYEPINQISWQAAVIAVLGGRPVEVLEEYEDREVRSVTFSMKIPAVIRYIAGKVGKRRGIRFSRENVYTRDKGRCQYCARKVSRAEATYDHVVPRSKGGKTRWENIVIACLPCNSRKANRTPAGAGMPLAVPPMKPKYLPETIRITFPRERMPGQWTSYLRSVVYMHGELETD
ncbi:MAG: HNH endonuclease [Deltaproteobacteria bacterium]|nr:HNH endonuclease [Deltaproteobacteria bacterium]